MSTLSIRKARAARDADDAGLKVHLFRNAGGVVCGWYIGPLGIVQDRISIPYLPRSDETRASVAVVRAIAAAHAGRWNLRVIDPDDLWDLAWQA